MRALVLERHGEPEEVLHLVEMAAPQPGPGEVRVRMRLSPVNPSDFNTIRGTYQQSLERAIWNRGGGPLHFDPGRTRALGELPLSPGADGLGLVQQGFLEGSNVNVVEELVSMIATQRAYEINSKAIQTSDQMLQRLGQL